MAAWPLTVRRATSFRADARFSFPDRRHSYFSGVYPGVRVPFRLIFCPSSLSLLRSVSRSAHRFGGKKFKIEIDSTIWREEIQNINRLHDFAGRNRISATPTITSKSTPTKTPFQNHEDAPDRGDNTSHLSQQSYRSWHFRCGPRYAAAMRGMGVCWRMQSEPGVHVAALLGRLRKVGGAGEDDERGDW